MSILWADSFEANNSDTSFQRTYEFTSSLSSLNYRWALGRFGGKAMFGDTTTPGEFRKVNLLGTPATTILMGFGFQAILPEDGTELFTIRDDAGNGDNVRLTCKIWNKTTTTFFLTFINALNETIAVTANYQQSEWMWFETKVFLDDTVGTLEWRVNEITEFIVTGNTCGAAVDNDWASVGFELAGNGAGGSLMGIDDLVISDAPTVASGVDGFLGDTVVQALYPVADKLRNEWTGIPDSAIAHEVGIDDGEAGTFDDATEYLQSLTSGQRDLFLFEPVGRMQNAIRAINFSLDIACPDATTETFELWESNETVAGGVTNTQHGSFTHNSATWIRKFFLQDGDSLWTPEAVKRHAFGFESG